MSDIRFSCPQCSKHMKVDASLSGRRGKCPRCHTSIEIPSVENAVVDWLADSNLTGKPAPLRAEPITRVHEQKLAIPEADEYELAEPIAKAKEKKDDETSWAPKSGEAEIEVVCTNCSYSSIFGESRGGKVGLCNNCGDSIIIPTLKQAQYAKEQQRKTRRSVMRWCILGGVLLAFCVTMSVMTSRTPGGRASYHAKQYTKNLLSHPDTASLEERKVVESKPDGTYLVKVVWKAENSFGVQGTVTMYVVVKVDKNGDSSIVDISENNPPLSW